jgi:CRISPR-associated endonuclease/helicase Cas3
MYAHSKEGEPEQNWQPLEEHLENVAKMAAGFAANFDSGDWAYNVGLLHDLGKADSSFQGYLKRSNGLDDSDYDSGKVNHSSAGAALAKEKVDGFGGLVLSYIAAGHHAGLPDWNPADTGNAALEFRLKEGRTNLERIKTYADLLYARLKPVLKPPSFVKGRDDFHLWVRMLYSCLVDSDFLDTEKFMKFDKSALRSEFERLPILKKAFDEHVNGLASFAEESPVNIIRREILKACIQAADKPPGFFTLTVPTGGGKTLSSMAFALSHSLKHQKSRIIYVIPYTSIIEQTAAIFSAIFGGENVVEHHSNLDPDKATPRLNLASENWDAPIIVTTNVQFFESLYAARSSRCRKLHNLVNSIVILDEAQMLPPELLIPCAQAMNQLVKNYGVTFVLATATQPAIPDLDNPVEIAGPDLNLYGRLKRTEIAIPRDINDASDWSSIAGKLKNHDQVLCIVNSRRDCYNLFKLMPEGTVHLSALMCGHHRSQVIEYIKGQLKQNLPIRVISTQLVEAGVDIDFPVVYRAFAGLDSIAQAAGRCNREGKLNDGGKLGRVEVFIPPKLPPHGLQRKGADTALEICATSQVNMDDPATYTRYFELFYSKSNDTGKKFLEDYLTVGVPYCQFRTAASKFNYIKDENQQAVIVRYGRKIDDLIDELRDRGPKRDILRKLQRYTVNLPARTAAKMKLDGLLEELHGGILVQTMPNIYSSKTGLDIYREDLPGDDLII